MLSKPYTKPTKPNRQRRSTGRLPIRHIRALCAKLSDNKLVRSPLSLSLGELHRYRFRIGTYLAFMSKEPMCVGPFTRDGGGRWWLGAPSNGFEVQHPRLLRKLRRRAR